MAIASQHLNMYDLSVVKQMANGFGDLSKKGGRTAPNVLAVFLRLQYALVRPLWAGCGGESASSAGLLFCQFRQTHYICPPTPFGDGAWVIQPKKGAYTMAALSIPAHSEQTQSPIFHLAARSARKAARQWFCGIPVQTIAAWRDTCRAEHCDGLPNPIERGSAFDDAFAREIGNLIIGGSRSHE